MKQIRKQYIPVILLFVLFLLFSSVRIYIAASGKEEDLQQSIAGEIVRFHVIANSDTKEDQILKMKVKKRVLETLQTSINQAGTKEEAEEEIRRNIPALIREAEAVVRENGFDYPVTADITQCLFPVKQYADMVLPAGEYEALRIEIGDSEGKNWWCVLYPSLCFVDETYSIVPDESKEALKDLLTEEEYESLWSNQKPKVKVRFKIWDWIKENF